MDVSKKKLMRKNTYKNADHQFADLIWNKIQQDNHSQ